MKSSLLQVNRDSALQSCGTFKRNILVEEASQLATEDSQESGEFAVLFVLEFLRFTVAKFLGKAFGF